ncbi:acyltransferase family protein [Listeria costaricensis]|uniref:acyltransferase family protein n=1 Tax=Listeria costaricensis TaxID=2026604 RepID=UPI000C082931|nr:acyltransferase family protein [Listeria costaricensis]
MKRTARYSRKYVPSIDGLRALAVLAVIAYHLNYSWAKGGFIGVDIFFVLSGYLITNILLTQWDKENTIHLKEFWLRRFRRLVPAAFVMIIAVVIFAVLFNRSLLPTLRGDAFASFFYMSNWWFIFHNVSYFDSFGMPSPLKNLWSLAIEEQFYLIWPLFLYLFLRYIKNPKLLLQIVIIVGVLSAILMGVLYTPGADPSRVYYGTDTRLFDLLAGCALAFVWPFTRLSPQVPRKSRQTLNIAGTLSVVTFFALVYLLNEYQSFLYRGGLLFVALLGVVMIATIAHPSCYLSRIFSFRPLRWIGTRSYGIYLWHYPIITLTTPVTEIGHPSLIRSVLQVAATFIIAELSYRFLETPIRKKGFIAFVKGFKHRTYPVIKNKPVGKWAAISGLALLLLIFSLGMSGILPVKTNAENTVTQVKSEPDKPSQKETDPPKQAPDEQPSSDDPPPQNSDGSNDDQQSQTPPADDAGQDQILYQQTLAIGDSIMIDIEPYLRDAVPNVTIDGKIGRQLVDAISLAPSYQQFNTSSSAVVLELGTNGPFSEQQLDTLLDDFDQAHIFLVNTRVPRGWESEVNESINEQSDRPNVTVVDWYSLAINHSNYFGSDGVHLTKTGSEAYVNLLVDSMKKNPPPK